MDCNQAEDLFESYLLGALDSEERRLMDAHLETCGACRLKLQNEGETVARLAFTVPQLEAPPRVKQRLFARIEAEDRFDRTAQPEGILAGLRGALSLTLPAHGGKAIAALLVVALVFGGVWFNNRLDRIAVDNEELEDRMVTAVERDEQIEKMVSDQRYFSTMTAAPGVSVNMLYGTEERDKAWGMIMCCAVSDTGTIALLAVLNLRPLDSNEVYKVWLIKDDQMHGAGVFTVDSTGYGQAVIIPVVPFNEVKAIWITRESAISSEESPQGTGVLKGDL